jgi:Tol biopolymer transport system component
LRQLTNDGKYKFLPHFSPDGTRIAYTRFETAGYGSPNATADVAVFNLATQTEKMITRGGANVQGTWSPDGNAIAFLSGTAAPGQGISVSKILIVSADGGSPQEIGAAAGTPTDMFWGDIAWSSGSGWILFTVAQNPDGGCFNVRTDKILPDGGSRTQVTNGGPNCTPPGWEQSGDADPGWSSDGLTIYSSRGFPFEPLGAPDGGNPIACRKLYSFPSDAWFPGKVENDLSLPAVPNCIEGVPKGSPDGTRVLLYRACLDAGTLVAPGTYVTDTAGSYRTFVIAGFGADWNPVAQ